MILQAPPDLDWSSPEPNDLRYWNYLAAAALERYSFERGLSGGTPGLLFLPGPLPARKIAALENEILRLASRCVRPDAFTDEAYFENYPLFTKLNYSYAELCDFAGFDFLKTDYRTALQGDLRPLLAALKKVIGLIRYFPSSRIEIFGSGENSAFHGYGDSFNEAFDEISWYSYAPRGPHIHAWYAKSERDEEGKERFGVHGLRKLNAECRAFRECRVLWYLFTNGERSLFPEKVRLVKTDVATFYLPGFQPFRSTLEYDNADYYLPPVPGDFATSDAVEVVWRNYPAAFLDIDEYVVYR